MEEAPQRAPECEFIVKNVIRSHENHPYTLAAYCISVYISLMPFVIQVLTPVSVGPLLQAGHGQDLLLPAGAGGSSARAHPQELRWEQPCLRLPPFGRSERRSRVLLPRHRHTQRPLKPRRAGKWKGTCAGGEASARHGQAGSGDGGERPEPAVGEGRCPVGAGAGPGGGRAADKPLGRPAREGGMSSGSR